MVDVPLLHAGTQFHFFFRPCRLTRLMRTCLSCSTSRSKRMPTLVHSRDSAERTEARSGWARCARTRRARRSSGRPGGLKIKKGRASRRRARCLGICKRVNPGCHLDSLVWVLLLWSYFWAPARSIGPLQVMMMGNEGTLYIYTRKLLRFLTHTRTQLREYHRARHK